MTKKWKLSKCKAIIIEKSGYAFGMSGIVIEPKHNKRIGHARYMYMSKFDYDEFLKNGYAIDWNGYYVFKYDKRIAATVTRILGDDGFKKFVATVLVLFPLLAPMWAGFIITLILALICGVIYWGYKKLEDKVLK